jgi:hypothetical protein
MQEQTSDLAPQDAWGDVSPVDYTGLPLGPGNEAMEGGASPAPRSYIGGAMGKVNARLSPAFADAAVGDPPPWEAPLRSAAEAARLSATAASVQPPSAGRSPEVTLQPLP